jgi:hypothetical protein
MPATTITDAIDLAHTLRTGDHFHINGRHYIFDGSGCWSSYAPTSKDGERITFYAWHLGAKGTTRRLVAVRTTTKLVVG